jgi:hypothetical protein
VVVAFSALLTALQGSMLGGAATEAYTPTVSAGSGTFTSVAATGRFMRCGLMCWVSITVTITTNGTAATSVNATLPFAAASTTVSLIPGQETTGSNDMLQGLIPASSSTVRITNTDGTYPGADGDVMSVSGWYEIAA